MAKVPPTTSAECDVENNSGQGHGQDVSKGIAKTGSPNNKPRLCQAHTQRRA